MPLPRSTGCSTWPLRWWNRPGEIVEVDCNATLELTRNFIRKLFLNHSILEESQFLEQEVTRRYFGSSGKAILAAYRDARQHYRQIVGK